MKWLTNMFTSVTKNTEMANMIGEYKGLYQEYKLKYDELLTENNNLKTEIMNMKIANSVSNINKEVTDQKPLTPKENKLYKLYLDNEPKNIKELSNLWRTSVASAKVYRTRLKKKGVVVSFHT